MIRLNENKPYLKGFSNQIPLRLVDTILLRLSTSCSGLLEGTLINAFASGSNKKR
jgi:hypothetical protein